MRLWRYSWTVGDRDYPRWGKLIVRWIKAHGFDAGAVFRVDHLGYRWVRVHTYAYKDGKMYLDHSACPDPHDACDGTCKVAVTDLIEYRW
jgi:hypothetical protein